MSGNSKAGHADRLLELDVLRGLAATAVMLFHYTVRFPQLYPGSGAASISLPYGFFGVEFFFCLSGFVIFMTLERTRRPMDFVVSRFSRLWPAFIAALIVTFLLVHAFGLPGREVTAGQALVNLTMLAELLRVPLVDPAYWSLQVELIFYAWMLLAFVTGLLRRIRALLWLGLVPPVLYAAAETFLHRELPYLPGVLVLVAHAPFFVIGITAYRIKSRGLNLPDLSIMVAAVAVSALCLSPAEGIVAAIGSAALIAVATGWLRWIAHGPLVFLGTISYTLYLVHQNIGYIVIRETTALGLTMDVSILLASAASILLAAALTYTIERPAREWIRSVYRKSRSRAAAAPATGAAAP